MTDQVQTPTDEELLTAYRNGNDDAFAVLVRRYEKELYHFLYRFTGQTSLAEEAFQESFLQIHVSANQFEADRRFRPWLYTIAANKARDLLRSRMRRPTVQVSGGGEDNSDAELWAHLLTEEATPDQLLDAKEQGELVRQAVEKLPDHLREILVMAYYGQLPYKEMSEALAIPLGTVKSRLHSAVRSFSEIYRKLQNGSDKEEH